jgi:regulator of cell morphogenesis and NO signaling
LVQRLLRDHRRWLHVDLPVIDHLLDRVSDDSEPGLPAFLPRLRGAFRRFRFDLERHVSNEENVLFPAIVELERGVANGLPVPRPAFGSIRNPIAMMQRDLESDKQLLGEIRDLVRGCSLPHGSCEGLDEVFRALEAIGMTLQAHVRLENGALFPRAIRLEGVAWNLT